MGCGATLELCVDEPCALVYFPLNRKDWNVVNRNHSATNFVWDTLPVSIGLAVSAELHCESTPQLVNKEGVEECKNTHTACICQPGEETR